MGWVFTQLCQEDPTVQWVLTQPCQEDPTMQWVLTQPCCCCLQESCAGAASQLVRSPSPCRIHGQEHWHQMCHNVSWD